MCGDFRGAVCMDIKRTKSIQFERVMENLASILINTYNPNQQLRSHAEKALEEHLHQSGAFYSLLMFIQNQSIDRELRLAAAIIAKNKVGNFWRDDEPKLPISIEEKETSKGLILQVLFVETDNLIRGMLAEIIRSMSEYDYPER